jgi:glyoxylase-like metal-dependent hydrolase (beta-lactamase superfamily II)
MKHAPIDLRHVGIEGAIGVYVLTDPEPTLVDPGPSTALVALRAGLAELGLAVRDLRHVVLTHIHLDHAGASGHLVRDNPAIRVHVHEDGAPHLADPEKLVASTRRTFGEAHDRLWGEVLAVPETNLVSSNAEGWSHATGLRAVATPGHLSSHLSYLSEQDGTFYAGDAMGIILGDGAPSHPPTPPPSLDLATWLETLEMLADYDPERLAVTHFGVHRSFHERRAQLAQALADLHDRVRGALERGDSEDAMRYHEEVIERLAPFRDEGAIRKYFETFPAATDWEGMKFHIERMDRSDGS